MGEGINKMTMNSNGHRAELIIDKKKRDPHTANTKNKTKNPRIKR